jgi:hypothetical protein
VQHIPIATFSTTPEKGSSHCAGSVAGVANNGSMDSAFYQPPFFRIAFVPAPVDTLRLPLVRLLPLNRIATNLYEK